MKKALIVGVDHYDTISGLNGCVDDAHGVNAVVSRHADGTINFSPKLLTGTGPNDRVTRAQLRDAVVELFEDKVDVALFYFAGHGYVESTGGYLCASDTRDGNDGLALSDVVAYANKSQSTNRVIILDSCHSGIAGGRADQGLLAEIKEGVTILTASTAEQYALETGAGGVFTNLLIDALQGAAGNLVGDVTPGSVYAHIDQSLGPWEQRPVFKTNVRSFVSLRKVLPPIELNNLTRIVEFFPQPDAVFPLDPSFEPESAKPDRHNCGKFAILQKYNRVNLVVPENAPHMYHAAMQSTGCRLTVLGQHYWRLVKKNRI